MKTIRLLFPLMLAMTAGCATTLEQSETLGTAPGATSERAISSNTGCVVVGTGRTIAPKVLARAGVELVSTGDGLAVGFGKTPYEAVAMKIDPSSAMTMGSLSRRSAHPIHHVTPFDRGGIGLDAAIDSDCEADLLHGSATISANEPFVVGTVEGNIAWATCASQTPHVLWPFSKGAVRDLRGIALADGGAAIVFRQDGVVWFGRLDSEKVPVGPLVAIAERPSVQSPTLAASGDGVLVVWAEQANAEDHWVLAGVSVAPCGHATPIVLDLPVKHTESDAMQPAIAAVDGGHFLLVWTEGPVWGHQVRAVTLEASGRAIGPVLGVAPGAESGWGRPAITADGRGAIVYLVPSDGGFALAGTPIACPLSAPHTARVTTARL